jgi:hypothetical protein
MSTNANIGYKTEEGTYEFIYSHWDGYLNGLGLKLLTDYNIFEDIKELVQAGDCSYPGEPYTSKGEVYETVKPRVVKDINDIPKLPYTYIWEDDRWIYTEDGNGWKELQEACK